MERKILFLIPSLSNSGGMERITTSLVNLLVDRRGLDIDVVVHSKDLTSFFPLDGRVGVHSLGLTGRVRDSRREAAKRLETLVRELGATTLVNVDVAMIQVAALARLRRHGCKMVTWEHFSLADAGFLARMKRYFSAVVSRNTVVLTEADKGRYPRCLRSRVQVLSNFTLVNDRGGQADLSGKRVLAVGRLASVKGFDLLLEAWAKVVRDYPDWHLDIVGGGEEHGNLARLIASLGLEGNASLEGVTSNVGDYYRRSSLFVLSSRFEPFGLVLIEAKSFGLPIVAFDCPFGPREVVRDGVDGILVENGNVERLAQAMMRMMQQADLSREYGAEALADFRARWHVENVLDKWNNII